MASESVRRSDPEQIIAEAASFPLHSVASRVMDRHAPTERRKDSLP